jgi:hypothetical protein
LAAPRNCPSTDDQYEQASDLEIDLLGHLKGVVDLDADVFEV